MIFLEEMVAQLSKKQIGCNIFPKEMQYQLSEFLLMFRFYSIRCFYFFFYWYH